ncbi:MAG: PilT/PilU family type 4a pilus ATPase [bacterium]|nr:PilT/PilU family type 4a pilus ATPase [bacterium]
MEIDSLLRMMIERGASDLQIKVGRPPIFRIGGDIVVDDSERVSNLDTRELIEMMLDDEHKKKFEERRWVDISYSVHGVSRFRVSVFHQRGTIAAVFRAIPFDVPTIDSLGLPEVLKDLALASHGLILVTGPAGAGKSTTLAAMIEYINKNRPCHIMTIEDPIEFLYMDKMATVTQKELGADALSMNDALTSLFRQDPNVILIGEMRDIDTFKVAIHAAETGHLALSTLHTSSAEQTIDRIVSIFPSDQHQQIRVQLSLTLQGIVSQRLVPRADGKGRVAAFEVMASSPSVRKLIEDHNLSKLHETIFSSVTQYRMQTLEQSLAALLKNEAINYKEAISACNNVDELKRALRSINLDEHMFEEGKGGDTL